MSTIPAQQPKALQLADRLKERIRQLNNSWNAEWNRSTEEFDLCAKSEDELRRLHAENEALRAKIAESRTPLTTDQKLRIALDCNMRVRTGSGAIKFAAAIEAAHGINP